VVGDWSWGQLHPSLGLTLGTGVWTARGRTPEPAAVDTDSAAALAAERTAAVVVVVVVVVAVVVAAAAERNH